MNEHRLPREAPPENEGFVVFEPATGKRLPIRECTDEQLVRHLALANEAHMALTKQVMMTMGNAVNAGKASAIIAYEIERRSKILIRLQ